MRLLRVSRVGVAACVAAVLLATTAGSVMAASPIYLCLSEKAGAAKSGGVEGKCPAPTAKVKYAKVALPKEESEQQTLLSILPYIKYVASGVGGKPTIQISGANLQIMNGEGKTSALNGAGNLVLGYDEEPGAQTGSHDLMLGTKQAYTSYGSILGGWSNTASGPNTVVFGEGNLAQGDQSGVLGGGGNKATSRQAQVLGGSFNTAAGVASAIGGGEFNHANARWAWVAGGVENYATAEYSSVSGGGGNNASNRQASVTGGAGNTASDLYASVSGGEYNHATGYASSVTGGYNNTAEAYGASILGGKEILVACNYCHFP